MKTPFVLVSVSTLTVCRRRWCRPWSTYSGNSWRTSSSLCAPRWSPVAGHVGTAATPRGKKPRSPRCPPARLTFTSRPRSPARRMRSEAFIISFLYKGYPRHRENRENDPKYSLSGKTQGIWKFCQNTGNLVCSSCKLHDSKGKGYCEICRENFHFFPEAELVCQVSFVYVIVTNYVNWQGGKL